MDRSDLQVLAEARVADAEALLHGGRWAAAYFLLGYAVECGLKACAARQFREPEINEWRLLFASPEVSAQGPRKVYERIRLALEELGDKASAAPFSVIRLLDPNAELVKLLKTAIRTGGGVGPIRFSKNAINGHFIDDALIYPVA
jgi:hypothetical protein